MPVRGIILLAITLALVHPSGSQNSFDQEILATYKELATRNSLDSALSHLNAQCYAWISKSADTARWCYTSLLALAEQEKDWHFSLQALGALSTLHRMAGNYQQAVDYLKKELTYLEIKQETNKNYYETINSIGLNFLSLGSLDSAQVYLKQAYLHYDKEIVSNNLGVLYTRMGEYQFATKYYLEALKFAETNRDTITIGFVLHNLGTLFIKLGNYEEADRYITQLEHLARNQGLQGLFAANQLSKAQVLIHQQQYDLAEIQILSSLKYYLDRSQWPGVSEGKQILAELHMAQKDYNQALLHLKEAKTLNQNIDDPIMLHRNQLAIAQALKSLGERSEAFRLLTAIPINEIQSPELVSEIHMELAQLHYAEGRHAESTKHYQAHISSENMLNQQQQNRVIYEMQTEQEKLEMDREIQALQIEQSEKQKRFALQKKLSIALVGLLLVALGLLGITRLNLKKSRLITAQQKQLHQKELQFKSIENNVSIMEALVEGQESERKRIAHDLHDGLGTQLAGLKLQMQAQQEHLGSERQDINLQPIIDKTGEVYEEVRRIAHDMMPGLLAKFGLVEAVHHLCDQLEQGYDHDINFQVIGEEVTIGEAREIMVYRIFQELLTNAVKHSGAKEISAQLSFFENEISIGVEDNGKGFDQNADTAKSGFGLEGLQSRVNYLKGQLSIDSYPARGTAILINFAI